MNAILMVPSFCGHRFGKQWKKNPTVTPPLGVLYVGGALERAGFQVRLLDMNVERIEREQFRALVRSADLAAISVMNANRRFAQELVDDVRAIKPTIKIICGGPHINCTMQPFPEPMRPLWVRARVLPVRFAGIWCGEGWPVSASLGDCTTGTVAKWLRPARRSSSMTSIDPLRPRGT